MSPHVSFLHPGEVGPGSVVWDPDAPCGAGTEKRELGGKGHGNCGCFVWDMAMG